ncbi:MAG: TAXI family TRAP transporter solute-binding subunit [Telmatospirillum sp.]|nr:TAXI family TRAP transporter solute-binding subunit [Telmatospirillum sp.]
MKKAAAFLAIAMTVAGGLPAKADFQDNQPISITTSGATATGFGRAVVEALNAIVRDVYPGSTMTFRPNTGAGGLVDLMNNDAQLSLGVTNVEIPIALEGQPPFEQPMRGKLSFVFNGLPGTKFFFIAEKAWAEKAGVVTLEDYLKKKPRGTLSVSARGTLYLNLIADALLKQGNSSVETVERQWPGSRVAYLPSARGVDELKDGKIDLQIGAAFQPFQAINEVARSRPLVWLKVPDNYLEAVAKQYDLEIVTFPKGFYSFLDEDVKTLRIDLAMLAATSVSEEAVYKYMKAVGSRLDRFRSIHPSYADVTLEELARKPSSVPYHPGAERYFREVGIIK